MLSTTIVNAQHNTRTHLPHTQYNTADASISTRKHSRLVLLGKEVGQSLSVEESDGTSSATNLCNIALVSVHEVHSIRDLIENGRIHLGVGAEASIHTLDNVHTHLPALRKEDSANVSEESSACLSSIRTGRLTNVDFSLKTGDNVSGRASKPTLQKNKT